MRFYQTIQTMYFQKMLLHASLTPTLSYTWGPYPWVGWGISFAVFKRDAREIRAFYILF